ncbi:kinase-like domain-containing protein [Chlamydoabsidia padenii]|nr:kinase-like domain-containing protein [Chlamydoabsidia padenii]
MTFFNKIIDKAKHHGHHPPSLSQTSSHEEQQKNDTGSIGTHASSEQHQIQPQPKSSTSSDKVIHQQPTSASSQDSSQSNTTSTVNKTTTTNSQTTTRYQQYDQHVMQQRKDRPRLKLDDFHLLRTLGTGSFGRVLLTQSRHNHRYYAIKILKKSEVVRLKQVEHTNNEKLILENVCCPFVVNLWGTFQDDVFLYMVMDYVPGGELFSVLRRSKRFPDHVAKFYAAEVILAIEYLHAKDIVYRDLKPENLLLDAHGHVKITDFGFAKHVPDVTWTLCGTPDYLAPEIIQSKGYGMAVDWWSLGVLIFEMLAGHPPFFDDDHLKLYEKIIQGKIKWPPYFEPSAKHLLERLLTSDLSKRYGNLKNGAEDIKGHPWFDGVDFDLVAKRQIRAPYVPKLSGEGDANNFDRYAESKDEYGKPAHDPYADKFPNF